MDRKKAILVALMLVLAVVLTACSQAERVSANISKDVDIIMEVAPGVYKKHFVGLNAWTTYSVEDISGAFVDPYHYEINFLPEMIVPITFTSSY